MEFLNSNRAEKAYLKGGRGFKEKVKHDASNNVQYQLH